MIKEFVNKAKSPFPGLRKEPVPDLIREDLGDSYEALKETEQNEATYN